VNFDNIEEPLRVQFQKFTTNNELAEYDLKSVMHYPSWGFSTDPFHKITMSTNNVLHQFLLDEERQILSVKDIKVMNILYNCKEVCPLGIEPCRNQGYRIPYDREKRSDECICVCPPGYRGELCEEQLFDPTINNYDLEYYGGLRCGGEISESQTIRTYDYPFRSHKKPGCSWWLHPPSNHSISVEFMDFSFMQLDTDYNACVYERVEIRYDGPGRNKFDPEM